MKFSSSDLLRFISKIRFAESHHCWWWNGARNPTGYGRFQMKSLKRTLHAHRVSYEIFKGVIPAGAYILHSCDNPRCVNPDHLRIGTPKDNAQDALVRGQMRKGEGSHFAKITARQVKQIKKKWASGATQISLMADFNLSRKQIYNIIYARSWKHLGA